MYWFRGTLESDVWEGINKTFLLTCKAANKKERKRTKEKETRRVNLSKKRTKKVPLKSKMINVQYLVGHSWSSFSAKSQGERPENNV